MTVQDLCLSAMQDLGASPVSGQTPNTAELNTVFQALNVMVDGFSAQTLLIPVETVETFFLITGQRGYSIGPTTADFITVRPVKVLKGTFIRLNASPALDVSVNPISDEQYYAISTKDLSGVPAQVNYAPTFPLGVLRFYPSPNQDYELHLSSQKPLTPFGSLSDTLSVGPGYTDFLEWQLAKRIMAKFPTGADTMQLVLSNANESMVNIKRMNSTPLTPVRLDDEANLSGTLY